MDLRSNMIFNCRCYNYRCLGKKYNESCSSSKDCMPSLYCDVSICRYYKSVDDECTNSEECGRAARCILIDPDHSTKKVCKSYLSVENGNEIWVESEYDVFVCQDGTAENLGKYNNIIEFETISDDVASNDYNFRTGVKMKCGVTFTSLKKGKACRMYSHCEIGYTDKHEGITNTKSTVRFAEIGRAHV